MNKLKNFPSEETLDPYDWEELKELGVEMVNDMIGFLQTIRQQPVWTQPTEKVKNSFKKELPQQSQQLNVVYNEFKQNILPYYIGNIHPRFWGWVMGTGTAQGMLAEMLAAGMNNNTGIGDHAAIYVEQQVIDWCKQLMQFPAESTGILVSGASVANLNALITARNAFDDEIRKHGLPSDKKMFIYASTETHSCIQKAAEIMGLGSNGVRKVNVDDNYEMDIVHLEALIEKDRADGHLPFCVVANAGTVNTGAIDPIEKIFWVCSKQNLWLHVDGAFGGLLKLLPEYETSLSCLEFADSIAFDLHKWMSVPYEAGVVLVKDGNDHFKTFAMQPGYLFHHERGIAAGPEQTSNFGFELSRNFKALKVWMTLKEHGIDKFIRIIRQNIEQAKYLAKLVKQHEELELMAPVPTNIVCFRFNPNRKHIDLDALNKEILIELHENGIAAPSYTWLKNQYCLRVAHVNHRSTKEDFALLVSEVIRIGNEIIQKGDSVLKKIESLVV